MADSSGRRLCLALRCAGLAFSSGLACANGCPGGAKGLRMESTIDALRFRCFAREDFIVLSSEVNSGAMLSPRNASVNRFSEMGLFSSPAVSGELLCEAPSLTVGPPKTDQASFGCWRARIRLSNASAVSTRCFC